MEAAVFGLVGVVLGAALTVAREWWFQWRRERKDAAFLVVQVVGQLDRFVAQCAHVVADDGWEGPPSNGALRRTQVDLPNFDPDSSKGEWKALPVQLVYEVLDVRYLTQVAAESVAAAFENATPPDFDEGFDERQFRYAELGLLAARLGAELRRHAGLPHRSTQDWDPVHFMGERKKSIEQRWAERRSEFERLTQPSSASAGAA